MRVTRSRGPRGGCRRLSRPDLSLHVAWKPDNRTLSGPGPPPSGGQAQRVPPRAACLWKRLRGGGGGSRVGHHSARGHGSFLARGTTG